MADIKYFNGNQGVSFLRDLFGYDMTDHTSTSLTLQYDDTMLGAFDSTRHAWSYEFTGENFETEVPDGADGVDDFDFVGGTVTRIEAFDENGDKIWDMSGLNKLLSIINNYANVDESWAAGNYIYAGGHTIEGSGDSMNIPDDWDGDDIRTGWGDDLVEAGKGNDYIGDAGGSDTYKGGKGSDTVSYSSWYYDPHLVSQGVTANLKAGTATGPDGHADTLVSIERLYGSFMDDTLLGNADDNRFRGMQGDDTINGRNGFDVLDYRRDADQGGRFGIRADLSEDRVRDGFHDDDTVTNVEAIRGTQFRDKMRDNKQDNYFEGRDGNDLLRVAKGNDTLNGGDGEDRFVFLGNSFADDIVEDFEDGIDELKIDNAANFAALTILDDGPNTRIEWNGNSVTLYDTEHTDITSDDFVF